MKKVLLLSCSTGQGHNSCAQAVKEYLEEQHINCEVKDALSFISPQVSDFMAWGHCFMYRYLPGLFRWGYRYSEKHPAVFKENSGIYKMLTSGAEHMYQFIDQERFDAVICTHPFSAMILTRIAKDHSIQAETAFVATDYICYPGMEFCDLQHYFIPCKCLANGFEKKGIPGERIIAAGIPVCRKMYGRTDKADAKRLLGVGSKSRHLLVMCGSMGCGPIAKLVKHIAKGLVEDMEVSVICGTNRRLREKLEQKYKRNEKIHIIGYTNQMPLYMDSADLLLTKPGGISITEAAVKKLPMVFVNAVAGCEQHNMDFFVKMGAAVTAGSVKELAEQSIQILLCGTQRQGMEDALQNYQYPGGAETIFNSISRPAFEEPGKEQKKTGQQFFSEAGSNGTYEEKQYSRLQGIQVS